MLTFFGDVLIDDDVLIQMSWKIAAHKSGRNLRVFTDPEDFFLINHTFDKKCVFYVDYKLENYSGEEVTRHLYSLGFTELYLTTGYPLDQLSHIYWVKGILGKSPPFIPNV